jgi:hypothetical protein
MDISRVEQELLSLNSAPDFTRGFSGARSYSNPLIILSVIEERKGLRKREKIHCHFRDIS